MKMMSRIKLIVSLLIMLGLNSCLDKKDGRENHELTQSQITEKLLEANEAAIRIENEQVEKLISISGWKTSETSTGLRYQIIESGKGAKAQTGQLVSLEYDVKLITGEEIYSSQKTGLKEFRIGSGGVESGLEEGILLLRLGDKARLIIPSYLAHGLSGDQDRIPPKATLIYTVKVVDIK